MSVLHEQAAVAAFLADPATHGIDGPVRRIETHVSVVFIAGERVYKMKRAVKFPFLDFLTLASRRDACEREIEINRRTAPEIYLRAVPVTYEHVGQFTIGGKGEPVEWLVEMRRFDEDTLFDRLAGIERGLRRPTMERLADEIARFHAAAPVRKDKGGAAGLLAIAENNLRSFRSLPMDYFGTTLVNNVANATAAALDGVADLLDRRRDEGRVRECHGDLHLRNICLVDGRPTLFDAIEFSEDFSVIDTAYDLAFLLMDLQFCGRARLATFVLNRYLDVGDDGPDVFRLMPVLISMRAQIRAHVGGAAARAVGAGEGDQAELDRARRYLEFSGAVLDRPAPVLIAVGGLSGSGKSRLARELAQYYGAAPGARVVRTDAIRKRLAGVGLEEKLGPDGYTSEMTERTYARFQGDAKDALAAGQSVIMDAVFAKPEQRDAVARLAAAGVPFAGVWVDAPLDVRLARIEGRKNNVSDATVDVAKMQEEYDLGEIGWLRVDSSGKKSATVEAARRLLSAYFP